jgi:hypothetical protein
MNRPKLKNRPKVSSPAPNVAAWMTEEAEAQAETVSEQPSPEAEEPAGADEPDESEAEESEVVALVPDEFDPTQERTKMHPTESALFKTVTVCLGTGIAIFLVKGFFGGFKGPPSVAPVVETVKEKPKVADNKSTDRTEIALVDSNQKRDAAIANLTEEDERKAKFAPRPTGPVRPSSPPERISRVSVPPPSYEPRRSYTLPRVPYTPPAISRPPAYRSSPSRSFSSAPRPAARGSAPAPRPSAPAAPTPEVNRGMVAFGALPNATDSVAAPQERSGLVNVDYRQDQGQREYDSLDQQQQAFLSGEAQTVVPSGTVIKGAIASQMLAAADATFSITTQQAVAGIPKGSEIVAQVTQLSGDGYITAAAVAINHSDGTQTPIPPAAIKITQSNGKLLKAKANRGFFQTGLGRALLGAGRGLADQVISRPESFTQSSFGTSTARGAGSRDLGSLSSAALSGFASPLLEQPQNSGDSGEGALLLNPGTSVSLKVSQSFIVY